MQGFMSGSPRMADRRVLILALVMGAAAAGLSVAFLSSQARSTSVGQSVVNVPVIVAESDIPVGTTVTDAMLSVRNQPSSAVASDVLRDTERAQAVGQTARYPIAKGEQVGRTRLVGAPEVAAISFQIPPGKRGFTMPVNASESPAGLLVPGDFVDIMVVGQVKEIVGPGILDKAVAISSPLGTLVTRDVNGVQRLVAADQLTTTQVTIPVTSVNPEAEIVVTLLQNIQVLSIDKSFVPNGVPYDSTTRGAPPTTAGTVTLALTPEQSQLMWLARQHGKMTLTLRRFGENEPTDIPPLAGPLQTTATPGGR